MAEITYEGFPVQYGPEHAESITGMYGFLDLNPGDLDNIGRKLEKEGVEYQGSVSYRRTSDGYSWHATLEFKVDDSKVAVLFPTKRNKSIEESSLERYIMLYSDTKVAETRMHSFVQCLEDTMLAYIKSSNRHVPRREVSVEEGVIRYESG